MHPQSSDKLRILLAEDNPGDVFLIREFLRKARLEVELSLAENGEDAMNFLQPANEGVDAPLFDLVVLDLNMPRHSGAEVLRALRANPRLAHTPVLVFTSSDDLNDRIVAEGLGASSYIQKPSTLEEYMKIGEHIKSLMARA